MKLLLSIVQQEDRDGLLDALMREGFRATCISTVGGFLRVGNATIMIGVEDYKLGEVLGIIEANCQARTKPGPIGLFGVGFEDVVEREPIEIRVGGATVMILEVEGFHRF